MELLLRILLSCLAIGTLCNADVLNDQPINVAGECIHENETLDVNEELPVPSIDVINSTHIKLRLNVEKYEKILPISVKFKVWSDEKLPGHTYNCITAHKNITFVEVFLKGLIPGVHYSVACVIYTNDKFYLSKLVNITTPCTESVASNFVIFRSTTNITVKNKVDKKVNDPCHYSWYHVLVKKGAKMLFNGSTAFPKDFNKLQPFAWYNIVISSKKSMIVDKRVYTLPTEPPAVPSIDLIEVDTKNSTMTVAWNSPKHPHHGFLTFYLIQFCESNSSNCDINKTSKVKYSELCKLWDKRDNMLCKTIHLPENTTKYDVIRIRAFNANVHNGSEPRDEPIKGKKLLPSSPRYLNISEPTFDTNITAELTWKHPFQSGDRLKEFQITIKLVNTTLKEKPWENKTDRLKIGSNGYQRNYSKNIELFPASTFQVSVNALTWSNVSGEKTEMTFTIRPYAYFDEKDLKPHLDKNIISIEIPKVVYDFQDSRLIVGVQGPGYCDKHHFKPEEDHHDYLNIANSTDEFAWTAGFLTAQYLNAYKEFRVGNGRYTGNVINYVLCPNMTYIIYMTLIDAHNKTAFETIKTNPIYTGKQPRSNVSWTTLTLPMIVVLALLIFKACRRKSNITLGLLPNKSTSKTTEDVPLTNDFYRKSHLSKVDSGAKNDEDYKLPYTNLLIIEQNKTYLMPVKIEDIEDYFEKFYSNSALCDEYMRCKNEEDYAVTVTEGLLPNTVNDFWKMIWQEEVQIVYTMSHLVENKQGKRKKYWPSMIGQKLLYGRMSVQFLSEKVHTDFTYRVYHVFSADHEVRKVSSILINDSVKYSSF